MVPFYSLYLLVVSNPGDCHLSFPGGDAETRCQQPAYGHYLQGVQVQAGVGRRHSFIQLRASSTGHVQLL